jgi:hypothetical protein
MAAKEILAGKAVVEVGTRLAIQRGLKAAEDQFRKFGATVNKLSAGVAAAGGVAIAGAAAAFAPLLAAAKQFADVGSQLDDMAQRTGAAVEGLSALGYAAKMSGTNLSAVEGGIRRSQKAIVDAANGSKDLAAAFQTLGLDVGRLMNLAPDAQFKAIAAAVGAIENPTQRAAMAMQIFGKSGTELLPLMRSNIKELIDEAEKLGLVMSGKNASAAAMLGDAIDKATDVIQGAFLRIGAAVAPVLTEILNRTIAIVSSVNKWIDANQQVVVFIAGLAAAVGIAGGALVALGGAGAAAGFVLSGLTTACGFASAAYGILAGMVTAASGATTIFGAISAAVLSPLYALVGTVGAIVIGVGALVAVWAGAGAYVAYEAGLIGEAFTWLKTKFFELLDTATQTLSGVMRALSSGQYQLAAQLLWAGVKLAFWQGADAALEAVGKLVSNALSIFHRFNVKLAELVYSGFSVLPSLIEAALTGGSITDILAKLLTSGFDIGAVLDDQVTNAQAELNALSAKLPKGKPADAAASNQMQQMQAVQNQFASQMRSQALAVGNAPQPPDSFEALRRDRELHSNRSYTSGAAFDAAENQLRLREAALMQVKLQEAAKARAELQAAHAAKPTTLAKTPEAEQLGESMAAATSGEMKKTSTVATFTAAAAGMLGGSGGDDRVAGNTAQTNALLRRMLKQRQKGLSFS